MPVQALPKSTLLQNGGIDMKTKLLSMLTASIMLTAAVPMQPIQAADKAASNGIFGTLPEWVPQSSLLVISGKKVLAPRGLLIWFT